MLLENTGRILCDPRNKDLTGKIIGKDIQDPGLVKLFGTKDGSLQTVVNGQEVRANVLTTTHGWKILMLQSEEEIFATTNTAVRASVVITLSVALIMLLIAWAIARSINRPLSLIVKEADKVATGDLNVNLDARQFYGELAELYAALLNMRALRSFATTAASWPISQVPTGCPVILTAGWRWRPLSTARPCARICGIFSTFSGQITSRPVF